MHIKAYTRHCLHVHLSVCPSVHPGPPIFTWKNLLESYICPYDNNYSSFIDRKCLLCVCVTVKIKYNLTIMVLLSTHFTRPLLGRYA